MLNVVAPSTQITVLDDLSSGLSSNLSSCVADFRLGSILDCTLLRELTRGADAVVHLAAIGSVPRSLESPRNSHDANITGTLNVLEVAKDVGTKQVIVASSSAVYGANPSLPKMESDWTRPLSPYGVTKLAAEAYALAYATSFDLRVLPLRFFNVYGPGQRADHAYAAVIPAFISQAIRAQPVEIYGDGLQTRDFTFVDDVNSIIAESLRIGLSSEAPVNLAFGTRYSLQDIIGIIEKELGVEIEVRYKPPRPSDVRNSSADNSLLRELIPGIVKTDFSAGIRKTIEWFKTHPVA